LDIQSGKKFRIHECPTTFYRSVKKSPFSG
jgi:hypothetical protein